jgi:hypothetical protein
MVSNVLQTPVCTGLCGGEKLFGTCEIIALGLVKNILQDD